MNAMGIERILGVILSWVAMTWGVLHLETSRVRGPWFGAVAFIAFFGGNFVYARLLLAEGRERERRRRVLPEPQETPPKL